MNATFETTGFSAASVWAADTIQDYYGTPEHLKVPPVLIATVAAIAQRTVAYLTKEINENPKFKKTFDQTIALGAGLLLAKPLTKTLSQEMKGQTPETAIGETPTHPGALVFVGGSTAGALYQGFDYLSPAKVLAKISEFPSKKFPIGGYLISLGLTIKSATEIVNIVRPWVNQDPEICTSDPDHSTCTNGQIAHAALAALAMGTITAIVLTDLLTPAKKTKGEKV